jgi:hypothetical protein
MRHLPQVNVAIALVVEIPAAVFILAPQRALRLTAFVLNVCMHGRTCPA